jgi:hypothetical protein
VKEPIYKGLEYVVKGFHFKLFVEIRHEPRELSKYPLFLFSGCSKLPLVGLQLIEDRLYLRFDFRFKKIVFDVQFSAIVQHFLKNVLECFVVSLDLLEVAFS